MYDEEDYDQQVSSPDYSPGLDHSPGLRSKKVSETGVLIFGAVGDVTNLNCDMIIMEEMASVVSTVRNIHSAGKKVGVWTVNTEPAMKRFLDSEADLVITDDILMAGQVQKELDERSDYDVLQDRSSDLWFY